MGFFNKREGSTQAQGISAWIVSGGDDIFSWVAINNASHYPISKVILSVVNVQVKASKGTEAPHEFRSYLSIAPPGICYTRIQIHRGMSFLAGIEIAFIDKDGQSWVRDGSGILVKIAKPTYVYYGIPLPISWEFPRGEME